MSKKKRIRRDIEKLGRLGRHWELLRLLENEGLVSQNSKEHREAWDAVIRRALLHQEAFDQFCREVNTLKTLPATPDFRLLMGIKGYQEGRGSPGEVSDLEGLTPDAVKLRSRFTAAVSSCPDGNKLRELLARFIREPEKITRRYFEQVAALVPTEFLRKRVSYMGMMIVRARRFNQKAAVARGWDGLNLRDLGMFDNLLRRLAQEMPRAFYEILLYPFIHNLAVLCRRLAPEVGNHRATQLLRRIPFLLPMLAGEKIQEVERKLFIQCGEWVGEEGQSFQAFQKKVGRLSLDEKLVLLSGLRLRIQDHGHNEPSFMESSSFANKDEFPQEREKQSDETTLTRSLLLLYRSILKEFSSRLPTLSSRERRELVEVMEPILLRDLDFILDIMEESDEFLSLLREALEAGCAGMRMGLLAFLAGSCFRDSGLRVRAEKLLDRWPDPAPQDMEWLAKEWSDFYYPAVRSLRPLLVRYQNRGDLLGFFGIRLCTLAEYDLITAMVEKLIEVERVGRLGILRRELSALSEFGVLDIPRRYLHCYPDDRLTLEGNLCWLNTLHPLRPEAAWECAHTELRRFRRAKEGAALFFLVEAIEMMLADKVEAIFLFMREHRDELNTLSTELLGSLLDELLVPSKTLLSHHDFLIHLEKVLARRVERGEGAVRPLMDKVRRTLRELAALGRKTCKFPRTRKRKG